MIMWRIGGDDAAEMESPGIAPEEADLGFGAVEHLPRKAEGAMLGSNH
jgi:hypothetical protein